MGQDSLRFYQYDSASQEVALDLLGALPGGRRETDDAPELPCAMHAAPQPVVSVYEDYEAEAVAGEPGFGAIIDRRLPIGPGFMEISLNDPNWFTSTV